MSTRLDGFPPELCGVEQSTGAVHIVVDETVYPLEALYGAAYIFIDRCYVAIDRPQTGRYRVTLAGKKGDLEVAALRDLVGEFANELLSCAWRHQITQQNRAVIETVAMQAMGGAMGPPSLDELQSFDFTAEPFEDPLGIAMSWEEKYKKKEPATVAPESAAAKAAAPTAPATDAQPALAAPAGGKPE